MYIKDLIGKHSHLNIHYVQYSIRTIESAYQLKRVHEEAYRRDWELKIRNANIGDENSKLGTYLIVNPLLATPVELSKVMETERITFHTV